MLPGAVTTVIGLVPVLGRHHIVFRNSHYAFVRERQTNEAGSRPLVVTAAPLIGGFFILVGLCSIFVPFPESETTALALIACYIAFLIVWLYRSVHRRRTNRG